MGDYKAEYPHYALAVVSEAVGNEVNGDNAYLYPAPEMMMWLWDKLDNCPVLLYYSQATTPPAPCTDSIDDYENRESVLPHVWQLPPRYPGHEERAVWTGSEVWLRCGDAGDVGWMVLKKLDYDNRAALGREL